MFWESKMGQLRKQVETLQAVVVELTRGRLLVDQELIEIENQLEASGASLESHKQRMDRKLAAIEKRLDRIEGVH